MKLWLKRAPQSWGQLQDLMHPSNSVLRRETWVDELRERPSKKSSSNERDQIQKKRENCFPPFLCVGIPHLMGGFFSREDGLRAFHRRWVATPPPSAPAESSGQIDKNGAGELLVDNASKCVFLVLNGVWVRAFPSPIIRRLANTCQYLANRVLFI